VKTSAHVLAKKSPRFRRVRRAGRTATLDLTGSWEISLTDPATAPAWQPINLPDTLDDAGLGRPLELDPALTPQVLTRLQRKVTHIGPAWYRHTVEIPAAWSGRSITLKLERVPWESRIFVDGHDGTASRGRGFVLRPGRCRQQREDDKAAADGNSARRSGHSLKRRKETRSPPTGNSLGSLANKRAKPSMDADGRMEWLRRGFRGAVHAGQSCNRGGGAVNS
jgi:hypothetical protein